MSQLVPTGDYGEQHRIYADKHAHTSVLAADVGPVTLLAAKSANHDIFIQRICISITTYAAKVWTLQDTASTPVQVALASIPAAAVAIPGVNTYNYDFGPHGFQLTQGKGLTLTLSAAGAAGVVTVDAYERAHDAAINDTATLDVNGNVVGHTTPANS